LNHPSEAQIQSDFFRWVDMHSKRHPELLLCYSIPNGSHKSPASAGLHKRTGLKSGVPDVHLPIAKGLFVGWWCEFKSKHGSVAVNQKEWHRRLSAHGHRVCIARSWDAAANELIDYLQLPIPKI
jgi:hypothetical protein